MTAEELSVTEEKELLLKCSFNYVKVVLLHERSSESPIVKSNN